MVSDTLAHKNAKSEYSDKFKLVIRGLTLRGNSKACTLNAWQQINKLIAVIPPTNWHARQLPRQYRYSLASVQSRTMVCNIRDS
jgi:hypothetical protein